MFSKTRNKLVIDLMDPSPLILLPRDPLTRARALFRANRARIGYVIDERTRKLLGIVTRADILRVSSAKSNATLETVMSEPRVILYPDMKVDKAIESMLRVDEWYAPVLDQDQLIGHLGLEHVIESMIQENPELLEKIKIEEIMTKESLEVAYSDDFVTSIWEKMRELEYAGFPVTDEKGRLVGIITQHDLLSAGARINLESSSGPQKGPRVRDIMTTSVIYLYPWSKALEAAELIVKKGFGRIPIVESESSKRLIGIVDREDIVRIMIGGGKK